MRTVLTTALGAALLLALGAQPALAAKKDKDAPAAAGPYIAQGIAWANIEAIHQLSNAYKTAEQQRSITYKPIMDQATGRAQQLDAQLKAMAQKLEADAKLPKANEAALQQQYQAIQRLEAAGKQEVQRMMLPVALSKAYVDEQIDDQMEKAIELAATKKKVSLVLRPDGIIYVKNDAYNLNQPILDELNVLLPSAQLIPPQGWEPRELREQRAQQAAQAAGGVAPAVVPATTTPAPVTPAPAPRPAGPTPDGR